MLKGPELFTTLTTLFWYRTLDLIYGLEEDHEIWRHLIFYINFYSTNSLSCSLSCLSFSAIIKVVSFISAFFSVHQFMYGMWISQHENKKVWHVG